MKIAGTSPSFIPLHSHVFLGTGHERNERKTWAVIWLCAIMMLAELVGGSLFGSLALVADGLHMSTHAGALLIAALAYTYSRRHANDARFVFGTGKLGDLAGFTSAIVLAMIALLIGFEAVVRLLSPVRIDFNEAIPIAAVGLLVNLASAWLLNGDDQHGHHHGHRHGRGGTHIEETRRLDAAAYDLAFTEHDHAGQNGGARDVRHALVQRDNNMRAAYIHVIADASVSVLAITGLVLGRYFGWVWMDPAAGIVGALVIANWSYGLLRDTSGILLDMSPDQHMVEKVRETIEAGGDHLLDLHLWRLGPGHIGAIVSVLTHEERRDAAFYRARLGRCGWLSHVTIEVRSPHEPAAPQGAQGRDPGYSRG